MNRVGIVQGAKIENAHLQRLSYRLDAEGVLRIAWGKRVTVALDAMAPPIPAEDADCNGTTITCHTSFNENVDPANIECQL